MLSLELYGSRSGFLASLAMCRLDPITLRGSDNLSLDNRLAHEPGHPLPGCDLVLIRPTTQLQFSIESIDQFRIAEKCNHLALVFEFREVMFEFHKAAFVDSAEDSLNSRTARAIAR